MDACLELLLIATVLLGCLAEENVNLMNHLEQHNENEQSVVTVLFAGDISLDKPIRKDHGSACPYSGLIANITKYFKSVDYNMVNLEAPFVSREMAKQKFLPEKGIHNMAWPEGIEALTSAGIKSVTIANNHLGDFGGDAVILTNEILQQNHIEVAGLTYGEQAPYSSQIPVIKEIKGIKIGFLAYCGDDNDECVTFRPGIKAGPALLRKEIVEWDISQLKPQVDIIVMFVHWGKEYMSIPNEPQRELAVKLRDLGVNVIIGSHPHVMQGHEWINDTLVHYSLGNFVFHPHFTFMGALHGRKDKDKIHARAIEMSKRSRGPAGFTELFKVEFTKEGIKDAYYLPIRIHVDSQTTCLYPKPKVEDGWFRVCGAEDDNCYAPREGEPVYP